MRKKIILFIMSFFAFNVWAQTPEIKLVDIQILFDPAMGVQTKLQNLSPNTTEQESHKIQSILLWYAHVLHRLGTSETGLKLREEVQKDIQLVATPQGMVRANLLAKSSFLTNVTSKGLKKWEGALVSLPGQGTSLNFPIGKDDIEMYGPASTLGLIQEGVKGLSESGLRLFVLSLGGMNKWYREIGKPSDEQSIIKATSYGLTIATDIVEKLLGGKPLTKPQ